MKKVYVSWSDVQRHVLDIARQLMLDNWQPEYIVGITRGGLIPATLLSQYLDVPMHTLKVSLSASGDGIAESNLWMSEDAIEGKNILIVDDIYDSGKTLGWIQKDWQDSAYPDNPRWQQIWNHSVKAAVLYNNQAAESSRNANPLTPAYYAASINRLEDHEWIVFPWEDFWRR